MKRFLITFLAVIAAQVVLTLAVIFVGVMVGTAMMGGAAQKAEVPPHACLIQEIPLEVPEYEPPQPLPVFRRVTTHTMILENLEKARRDPKIDRVVLKLDTPEIGWGKMQEIRQRIAQLRAAHKPVYAYTSMLTTRTLYLASACDSIIVTPGGIVWLTGLMSERYYLRGMLEKLDVTTQVSRIKEYKAAAEMVTRTDMSPEARENADWILKDLYDDLLSTVAQDRRTDRARVEQWLGTSQFTPEEAVGQGITDGVLFWEQLRDRLAGAADELAAVEGADYAKVPRAKFGLRGKRIAVVHGQGTITTGKSGWGYPFGVSMGDETMVEALEEVAADDAISGILLRLDTPGGMGLASDRIGRAVAQAAASKPVVISSVDMNASGGYMVSYRCSTIVAPGGAIVGSIGSISGRPDLSGLFEKLGITFDRATIGPHATLWSGVVPMTDEEFQRFDQVHWAGYNQWVEGVAEHRHMTFEQVDRLARGRVFTGRQALANGLIDAVGGFDEALALLKQQLKIPESDGVTLLHYPVPKSFMEELMSGDWPGTGARLAARLGLRTESETRAASTIDLWTRWLESREPVLLCPWRF
jgi:protease-4